MGCSFDLAFQEVDHLRAIPLRATNEAADLPSSPINYQSARQADEAQFAQGLRALVNMKSQIFHPNLVEEVAHGAETSPVNGQGDHGDIPRVKFRMKAVEARHLLAAGEAPSRPDIQENHPVTEVRQIERPSGLVSERDVRHRTWLLMHHQMGWPVQSTDGAGSK